jgi:hypothetical protein
VTTPPQDDPLPLLALHERARCRAAAEYALRLTPPVRPERDLCAGDDADIGPGTAV